MALAMDCDTQGYDENWALGPLTAQHAEQVKALVSWRQIHECLALVRSYLG